MSSAHHRTGAGGDPRVSGSAPVDPYQYAGDTTFVIDSERDRSFFSQLLDPGDLFHQVQAGIQRPDLSDLLLGPSPSRVQSDLRHVQQNLAVASIWDDSMTFIDDNPTLVGGVVGFAVAYFAPWYYGLAGGLASYYADSVTDEDSWTDDLTSGYTYGSIAGGLLSLSDWWNSPIEILPDWLPSGVNAIPPPG